MQSNTVDNDASTVSTCGEEVFAVLNDTHAVASLEITCILHRTPLSTNQNWFLKSAADC